MFKTFLFLGSVENLYSVSQIDNEPDSVLHLKLKKKTCLQITLKLFMF